MPSQVTLTAVLGPLIARIHIPDTVVAEPELVDMPEEGEQFVLIGMGSPDHAVQIVGRADIVHGLIIEIDRKLALHRYPA